MVAAAKARGLRQTLAQEVFPPDEAISWENDRHRLDRRRLKRVTVSLEQTTST
jgi:hypothetical protein